ncbi:rhomboid family intramembrane serine protease [Schleiferia thermophila]|uniref:Membrane associated rhomboid family serine protease n=1 Tax=Schleiferia thermophila TaxID=884107 RepID=A0A369A847_9FLAO|nr:rhomboid family intramembrane serine protease [Schleiferia thermophila]RCX05291.1 membrane associated rhomboid family serine protease [Schleiferia thermophila]GCD79199.1 rhomboid family intramembrane serine protease [Schleiferia thermophila]
MRSELKRLIEDGDMLTRLIVVNVLVFVVVLFINIFQFLFQSNFAHRILYWFTLPAFLPDLVTRPWTLITYMFLHEGVFHLIFNLLWLYFGGLIFLNFFSEKQLLGTYISGGLAGGVLYIISYNLFPVFETVLPAATNRGASAAVMAIIIAAATYAPGYPVRLFFVLEVKLWVVAVIAVLFDLAGIERSNAGGHIAHLGGAIFGYLMAKSFDRGVDITHWIYDFSDYLQVLFGKKKKLRKVYSKKGYTNVYSRYQHMSDQERLDQILDKISMSGYDSLSKEEKEFLFKIGKQ